MRWLNEMIEEFFDLIDRIFRSFSFDEPAPDFEQTVLEMLDILNRQLYALHFGEKAIMTAVQIEQEDLDAVASALEALVGVIAGIDTTVLPPADESALSTALADVTSAINGKLPVSTPISTPPGDTGDTPPPADGGGDTPPADSGEAPVDGGDTPPADA